MRMLIQRVLQAQVVVEGKTVGSIGNGALVFLGIKQGDTEAQAVWLAAKLSNLRIFEDASGKMNQSLLEKKGEALIVSQFTLYANCNDGRRPSFTQAASPGIANSLYEKFLEEVRKLGISIAAGIFGADMKVTLTNDGPITLIVDRDESSIIPNP